MKKSNYDVFEVMRLIISYAYTKLYFPQARLVRWPSVIRGRKFIKIGSNFVCGYGCRIDAFQTEGRSPRLLIGKNVQLNDHCHIACAQLVKIDDFVLVASRVFITDHNHGCFNDEKQFSVPVKDRDLSYSPVHIKRNVWLGEGVIVLPGVVVGEGSIIGAGAVVTKDVPSNSLAVGNPARVIKVFDESLSCWVKV